MINLRVLLLAAAALLAAPLGWADSVVVFSEVMYHPSAPSVASAERRVALVQ